MYNNNINKEVNLNDFDLEGFAHISHQAEESERSRVLSPEVMNASAAPDDTYDEVTAVARELVSRGIDITTPYDNWIHLGFALANGLGERGQRAFPPAERYECGVRTEGVRQEVFQSFEGWQGRHHHRHFLQDGTGCRHQPE